MLAEWPVCTLRVFVCTRQLEWNSPISVCTDTTVHRRRRQRNDRRERIFIFGCRFSGECERKADNENVVCTSHISHAIQPITTYTYRTGVRNRPMVRAKWIDLHLNRFSVVLLVILMSCKIGLPRDASCCRNQKKTIDSTMLPRTTQCVRI